MVTNVPLPPQKTWENGLNKLIRALFSWQSFCLLFINGGAMILLEMANGLTDKVQEIAFGLSILISALFIIEYKRYSEEDEKKDMIDNFLND
jgi:hypothetical protein